jgi:hypothetical protein
MTGPDWEQQPYGDCPTVNWATDARESGPMPLATRLVLATLAIHVDDPGTAPDPSTATLSTMLGMSPRTVRRHKQLLRERGLLARVAAT